MRNQKNETVPASETKGNLKPKKKSNNPRSPKTQTPVNIELTGVMKRSEIYLVIRIGFLLRFYIPVCQEINDLSFFGETKSEKNPILSQLGSKRLN